MEKQKVIQTGIKYVKYSKHVYDGLNILTKSSMFTFNL